MKKFTKKILIVFFASFLLLAPAKNSEAWVSTMFQQLMQQIVDLFEYVRKIGVDGEFVAADLEMIYNDLQDYASQLQREIDDATTIANQYQQISEAIKNNNLSDYANILTELDIMSLESFDWDNYSMSAIEKALALMTKGEAVGVVAGEVDSLFTDKYKGYAAYAEDLDEVVWGEKYEQWSKTNTDTVKGALKAIGIQVENYPNEKALMEALKAKSQSAEGNKQVAQVANEILAELVGQMQQMRQLMMGNNQMFAAYLATEQDKIDVLHKQNRTQAKRPEELGGIIKPVIGDAKPMSMPDLK